jgi:NADPH-dependent 2,4-dienoyl-CoA reductase/sulfur reductase-like enzyme
MLNQIKASYGGKTAAGGHRAALGKNLKFFAGKASLDDSLHPHLSGQDGFLAAVDGTSMGNATDILVVGGGPARLAAAIAA